MNIRNALLYSVNYPLTQNQVDPILIQHGIEPTDEFDLEIGQSKDYELAKVDVYIFLLSMVNLSQGGSITQAQANLYRDLANRLLRKYGMDEIEDSAERKSVLKDGSYLW